MNSRTRHSRWLVRAEWVVAVSACLWAVVVHVVVFLNAGPLWRDEVNSYNLAAIGTLADAWGRMAEKPGAARICLASAATMLAVHCLYYNVVYLFVIAGGAALVCAWRRRWMAGTAVLAIGGIGAASMLAYLPSMSRRSGWVILINQSIGLPWLAGRFFETLELAGAWMPWVWVGVGAAALAACVHVWRRRKTIEPPGPADQAVFWAWVIGGGLVCHFLFLLRLG